MDDLVAGGLGGDLQAIEDRYAGRDQCAQSAGKPGDGGLPEDVAQNGSPQQHAVDLEPAARGGVVPVDQEDGSTDHRQNCPPVGDQPLGQPDYDAGGQGELQVYRGEHALERGNDEDEQHGDGDDRHAHDDGRVYHGALHLPDEGVA